MTLVLMVPVAGFALGLLWLVIRSSVVITQDDVVVRPFGDPRTRRIPRAGVVGVRLVQSGSTVMTAVAPRLEISAVSCQPRDLADSELTPLIVWTWWRTGVPRRATRLLDELTQALELDT